jgi:hypothetical protein
MMRVPVVENYTKSDNIRRLKIARPLPVTRQFIIVNDKDRVKLIKTIEQIVRASMEYKQYIQFLKDEIDMSCCAFFNNATIESRVKIEIHHEPFTLFDITNIILDSFIKNGKDPNPILVAEEVMRIHYKNLVGLIPLSATCHGLVHDGRLLIPLQCVYGDFMSFIDEYYEFIPADVLATLHEKINMSKEIKQADMSILEKRYTYLEVDGFTLPQQIL